MDPTTESTLLTIAATFAGACMTVLSSSVLEWIKGSRERVGERNRVEREVLAERLRAQREAVGKFVAMVAHWGAKAFTGSVVNGEAHVSWEALANEVSEAHLDAVDLQTMIDAAFGGEIVSHLALWWSADQYVIIASKKD